MKVSFISGKMKPYTGGHHELIKMASKENDKVIVFVSNKDYVSEDHREEASVFFEDMKYIFDTYIVPILPGNVSIQFTNAPIRSIYSHIGKANESNSQDFYNIYSDDVDIFDDYPEAIKEKYFGRLYRNGQINFIPVQRISTCQISSTEMRKFLAHNMRLEFYQFIPKELDVEIIWQILHSRHEKNRKPTEDEVTRSFFSGFRA